MKQEIEQSLQVTLGKNELPTNSRPRMRDGSSNISIRLYDGVKISTDEFSELTTNANALLRRMGIILTDTPERKLLNTALRENKKSARNTDFIGKLFGTGSSKYSAEAISRARRKVDLIEDSIHRVNTSGAVMNTLIPILDLLDFFIEKENLFSLLQESHPHQIGRITDSYRVNPVFGIRRINFKSGTSTVRAIGSSYHHNTGSIRGYSQAIFPSKAKIDPQFSVGSPSRDDSYLNGLTDYDYPYVPVIFCPEKRSTRVTEEIEKMLGLFMDANDFAMPITITTRFGGNPGGTTVKTSIQEIAQKRQHDLNRSRFLGVNSGSYTISFPDGTSIDGYGSYRHSNNAQTFSMLFDVIRQKYLNKFDKEYQEFRKQLIKTIYIVYEETAIQMKAQGVTFDSKALFNNIAVSYSVWLSLLLQRFNESILSL